jgi:hypothetical protein
MVRRTKGKEWSKNEMRKIKTRKDDGRKRNVKRRR